MREVHWGCPFSMLLYIRMAIKYLQFSLMPTQGLKEYRYFRLVYKDTTFSYDKFLKKRILSHSSEKYLKRCYCNTQSRV